MMGRNIVMQDTVVDKPEDVNVMKIHDNEHYTVDAHVELIVKGALIAVVVLTFLAFTWKGLSTTSVNTSNDYIEIENVEVD